MAEREIVITDAAARNDLATLLRRAVRTDPAAVVRLHRRTDTHCEIWLLTSLETLATRVIEAHISPTDLIVAADHLIDQLSAPRPVTMIGHLHPGYAMDSAWRGSLPPADGFMHIDNVPTDVIFDLVQRGIDLTDPHGRMPSSMLNQNVLTVTSGQSNVNVPMRCLFTLNALGFIPSAQNPDVIRIRSHPNWIRIDGRYGSVYERTTSLMVIPR